jgi:hypothetical protein
MLSMTDNSEFDNVDLGPAMVTGLGTMAMLAIHAKTGLSRSRMVRAYQIRAKLTDMSRPLSSVGKLAPRRQVHASVQTTKISTEVSVCAALATPGLTAANVSVLAL